MKLSISDVLFLAPLLVEAVSATSGTFSLPVDRKRHHVRAIQKRDGGPVDVTLINPPKHDLYTANITLGTPPQQQTMQIDTGSSDLWVETATSTLCEENSNPCAFSGTFDSSKSSTFKVVSLGGFNITYGDHTGANGSYATDTLVLGGLTIPNFEFAVADESTSTEAVFGIGFDSNEASAPDSIYPNIIDALISQKAIDSKTYSLFLDSYDAPTGTLLFGGIDTSKYSGSLYTLPILPNKAEGKAPTDLAISLVKLSLDYDGSTQDYTDNTFPYPALLDSGSTQTILPDAIFQEILKTTNAQLDQDSGVYLVSCSSPDSFFSYQFGSSSGPIIKVPWTSIALPVILQDGTRLQKDGKDVCSLDMSGDGDSIDPTQTPILGDSFLRSAYIVFDLGNLEISIAEANTNSTASSNIVAIPSAGVGAIVSVTTATGGPTPTASVGFNGTIPHSGAPTGTGTPRLSTPTSTSGAGHIHIISTGLVSFVAVAAGIAFYL